MCSPGCAACGSLTINLSAVVSNFAALPSSVTLSIVSATESNFSSLTLGRKIEIAVGYFADHFLVVGVEAKMDAYVLQIVIARAWERIVGAQRYSRLRAR